MTHRTTRATTQLDQLKVSYTLLTYEYEPGEIGAGLQAAEALGVEPHTVFKTLVVLANDQPVMVLIPSDKKLNLKNLAKAHGAKKASMMPIPEAEKLTGYKVGGLSPYGCKTPIPIYLDQSAETLESIIINGGGRGFQVKLSPKDITKSLKAHIFDLGK